jgi:SAM-dependent methyltransferase
VEIEFKYGKPWITQWEGPMTLPDQFRKRLYEAYSTTHSGIADDSASVLAFMRQVLPHLPSDLRSPVVDLGCGQGLQVQQLVKNGYLNAWGIDISPEQVALAHANGIHQVELGDFFQDSFNGRDLGAAIGLDFFEHLKKDEVLEAFDRIHQALNPGGVLVLRVPNSVSPFGGNYRYGDFTHETSFTARSLRQLGAAARFQTVDVYASPPQIHGLKSLLRSVAWRVISAVLKVALAAETGVTRGHLVTQNIVAVMTK